MKFEKTTPFESLKIFVKVFLFKLDVVSAQTAGKIKIKGKKKVRTALMGIGPQAPVGQKSLYAPSPKERKKTAKKPKTKNQKQQPQNNP